jgi:hypothetical protein
MNSAWDFLKRKRKLLLCLAALLVLLSYAIVLLNAPRAPLHAFIIKTNEVAGVQWVHLVISNSSPSRLTSIQPHTEVMTAGKWEWSSVQQYKQQAIPPGESSSGVLPGIESITYEIRVPPESARWRLNFFAMQDPTSWQKRIARCFKMLGLKCPFKFSENFALSEHTVEFGK